LQLNDEADVHLDKLAERLDTAFAVSTTAP